MCYKYYESRGTLQQFPLTRRVVPTRQRYDDWVASGMRVTDYARHVGIPATSLSRALRVERDRRRRCGLSYLDGYRRLQLI